MMRTQVLLWIGTVVTISGTAFAASSNVDKHLGVSGAPTVSAYTGSGYIHLRAGSDSEVHVQAHLYTSGGSWWSGGGNQSDMQAKLDALAQNFPIRQTGNTITIGERHGGEQLRNVNVDYEITLPRGANVEVGSGSGDIESQDVGSAMKAESGSGSVRIRSLHGSAVLHTGSGDIELEESGEGPVRAETGSGSVRLRGVNGPVHVQTGSGDIEIAGQITGDSTLQTGSGSVRLQLGPAAHYALDASTGSGSIRTEAALQVRGTMNRQHVQGTANGGGPNLRVVTGSGDIEIR